LFGSVPQSWVVTPVQSVADLDNIKLQISKHDGKKTRVEALFQLKNILIEGID